MERAGTWPLLLILVALLSACGGSTSLPASDANHTPPGDRAPAPTTAPAAAATTAPASATQMPPAAPAAAAPTAPASGNAAQIPPAGSAATGEAPSDAVLPDQPLPPARPEVPRPPAAHPDDTAFFDDYGINPFAYPSEDPYSTFAIDVDTASYTLMRSYLRQGTLPPPAAVRTEEYVNFFRQDYAPPVDSTFAIFTDIAPAPFVFPGHTIMRVGVQGRDVDPAARKPASLIFVVDVSGSMDADNKLPLVKRSLAFLLDQLDPTDSVGIVAYGDRAVELLEPTSVADRERVLATIERLAIGGSTNVEDGLRTGYAMAERAFRPGGINRVILCSDGVANVGNTGPQAILQSIGDYSRDGIGLTTVGFGMGELNDVLMEQLADQGDGSYAYVDTLAEARRVFGEQLTNTIQIIARDAKIQVEFNPQTVLRYRLLGYENRDVADRDFRNDTVDAGEVGAGASVTALYEVALREEAPADAWLASASVRYLSPESDDGRELRVEVLRSRVQPSFDDAPARFRQDVAVAAYAELLRGGYWTRTASLGEVADLAERVSSELPEDRELAEFATLVAQAARMR